MKINKKFVKYFLMAFLICGISMIAYADDLDDAREDLEDMESSLDETLEFIESIKELKDEEEAYVKALDEKLEEYALELYNIGLDIEAKEAEIAQTEADILVAEEDIAKQYADMKLRIQYMYENGEISDLQMIFDSQNMADMLNRAEYINKITEYDRDMLMKLKAAKDTLEAQKEDLETQMADLLALQEAAEAKYASTEQLIADKETVIETYEGHINESEMTAEEIQKEIEAQEQLIAELEEIERQRELAQTQIMYDGGKMMWPLPGYFRLSDDYGMRNDPFGGPGQKMHNGIDIPAPAGTPIIAAYDGQVAWSYYNWSAGNWIGIDHGDGIYTVYMHMSAMLVSEGQYVKKGDVIGLVGTTGSSTGNHLHFAVRLDGSYVNPHDYVTTAY